ncbi:MAG: universal stress protein [Chloroflexi bacterium]|nr:universal stress protein [Chloroflexota bacterium]
MELFNNIIVPLDGSDLSAQALPAASIMAKASGASMTLLRSYDSIPEWKANSGQGRFRGAMAEAEHDRISALLRAEKQLLEGRGVDTRIDVMACEGPAHEAIINLAEQQPGAMIAMSTHGRGGLSRMLMGSVTAKVVRAVGNPTLITRCNERDCPVVPHHLDNIIVPLDGSDFAEYALPYAQDLAAALGARVTLVRTTPDSEYFRVNTEWGAGHDLATMRHLEPDNLAARLSEKAKAYLWRKADELSAQYPAFDVEAVHRLDTPSETVIRLTGQLDNGLVVMATHGRRGIGRALLGSVADRIVRYSQMPTLLVRGPAPRDVRMGSAADAGAEREQELLAV